MTVEDEVRSGTVCQAIDVVTGGQIKPNPSTNPRWRKLENRLRTAQFSGFEFCDYLTRGNSGLAVFRKVNKVELQLKRQQRVNYLKHLSPAQKKARLLQCHQAGGSCETVVSFVW